MVYYVVLIVGVALVFDFYNGMNDAANSIATIVSTRVLTPLRAVVWAAFFNFVAAFGFGVKVATTVGKGIVDPAVVDAHVILAGLIGAIACTALATHFGIPISASHSLIGGLIGAGVTNAGWGALNSSGLTKVVIFIVLAPVIGFFVGSIIMTAIHWIFRRATPGKMEKYFKRLQLVSAAAFSLGHGTNDAQKTMGIIAVLLFSTGYLGEKFYVPIWVILSAHAAIALGTLIGGWRVIRTLGLRVTKLRPVGGFSAETAAASSLVYTALGGIPASTTHTIAGAIMGVGSTKRLSAVRWGIGRNLLIAWILTIPLAAGVAAAALAGIKILLAVSGG